MKSNLFQLRSLKARMTLFTLAVFLVGLLSLSFYISQTARADVQRLLGEQQFSAVSLIAEAINQELDLRLDALKTMAGEISPNLLENPAALQRALEQRPILLSLFNSGVLVLRPDGTTVADAPHEVGRLGTNYMDRDYIAAALKDGKTAIGRPAMGKVLRAPVFGMVVPIRDAQGEVIGALTGVINLGKSSFLDKLTEGHHGTSGGYLLVVPQYRMVVTATNKRRAMETLPAPGVNPMIDRVIDGYEGSAIVVNPLGEEVLSSDKKIPAAGWILVASLPTSEAFAPIKAMQRRLLLSTLLFALLASALVWWLSSRLIRRQLSPMLAATRALTTLPATSQTVQALPVTSQDEIGELLTGFNRLLVILAQREDEIRQLAFFDPLTQLPNRRLFDERLSQAIAASRRSLRFAAVMFLDLDNFKPLNDAHGHEAGDLLLQEVANRLKNCVRQIDSVARFGGDEFVVMLSELDADQAQSRLQAEAVAEKVRNALGLPYRLVVGDQGATPSQVEHRCTASIGVVLFCGDSPSRTEVLQSADAAMYQAKESGRNQVCFHNRSVS